MENQIDLIDRHLHTILDLIRGYIPLRRACFLMDMTDAKVLELLERMPQFAQLIGEQAQEFLDEREELNNNILGEF